MNRLGIEQLRLNIAETVNRAGFFGERIILERHGKPVAAIVPLADVELLEKLEDVLDVEEAQKRLAELKSGKTKSVPWEKVKATLGL